MNYEKLRKDLIDWIIKWFQVNGEGCTAIVGMSGGLDSAVCAALCKEALGRSHVLGICLPCHSQAMSSCIKACTALELNFKAFPINGFLTLYRDLIRTCCGKSPNDHSETNFPPRLRMALLYGFAQNLNGRVVCTTTLTEDTLGQVTRWGDNVGDFCPLLNLTHTEVHGLGELYKLPTEILECPLFDRLPRSYPLEEKLGFPVEVVDTYIREHAIDNAQYAAKIDYLFEVNDFKRYMPDAFSIVSTRYKD